jgi:hypothetical protein
MPTDRSSSDASTISPPVASTTPTNISCIAPTTSMHTPLMYITASPSFDLGTSGNFAASSGVSVPACSCLSTSYLTLNSFQTVQDFAFPTVLSPLRSALRAIQTILFCPHCPNSCASALLNVQLLIAIFHSTLERFKRALHAIDEESDRMRREGRKKPYRVGEMSGEVVHTGTWNCPGGFEVLLGSKEWSVLARRGVRGLLVGEGVRDHHREQRAQQCRNIFTDSFSDGMMNGMTNGVPMAVSSSDIYLDHIALGSDQTGLNVSLDGFLSPPNQHGANNSRRDTYQPLQAHSPSFRPVSPAHLSANLQSSNIAHNANLSVSPAHSPHLRPTSPSQSHNRPQSCSNNHRHSSNAMPSTYSALLTSFLARQKKWHDDPNMMERCASIWGREHMGNSKTPGGDHECMKALRRLEEVVRRMGLGEDVEDNA